MKKVFLTAMMCGVLWLCSTAQLIIQQGAAVNGIQGAYIVLDKMGMQHDAANSLFSNTFKFTGDSNVIVKGLAIPSFSNIEMAKINNAKLILQTQISVSGAISFNGGLIDLNGLVINLGNTGTLMNENESSRITETGAVGGYIVSTADLNAPNAVNTGNLGAILTSTANLGTVTIKRGHQPQSGTGINGSINRYYIITPQNNSGLNAATRLNYFDAEKNGKDENNFVLYQSNDKGSSWTNQSQTTRNTVANYVEKSGLNSLSEFTLSDIASPSCSATGVVATVKSGKQSTVNVNWTTATETGNKGFAIERRLKNDAVFSQLFFVNSKAPGGNSISQLSYSYIDNTNANTDTSYYRLRIEGLNSSICYSDIKILAPKGGGKKNTTTLEVNANNSSLKDMVIKDEISKPKLIVGPNPNNGSFFFTVGGLKQQVNVALFSVDGKMIGQYKVNDRQRQQVTGLHNGLYLLKVDGMAAYKIMVQGSGTGSTTVITNSSLNKY